MEDTLRICVPNEHFVVASVRVKIGGAVYDKDDIDSPPAFCYRLYRDAWLRNGAKAWLRGLRNFNRFDWLANQCNHIDCIPDAWLDRFDECTENHYSCTLDIVLQPAGKTDSFVCIYFDVANTGILGPDGAALDGSIPSGADLFCAAQHPATCRTLTAEEQQAFRLAIEEDDCKELSVTLGLYMYVNMAECPPDAYTRQFMAMLVNRAVLRSKVRRALLHVAPYVLSDPAVAAAFPAEDE
jgi:uncharacterized protein with GYD domain